MSSSLFRYVQKEPSPDDSFDLCHIFVFFVAFTDERTDKPCRLKYVSRVEIIGEFAAVKFYASRDRKSRHDKYSLAHGQLGVKAVLQIFDTCLSVIKWTMAKYPDKSFIFKGAEGYDPHTMKWEDEAENQRFRIYRSYLSKKVGTVTFAHYHVPENSIYMLIRRSDSEDIECKQRRLLHEIKQRYGLQ